MKNLIFLTILLPLVACTSFKNYNTDTAEGAFQQAKEYEKYERYDEAITGYSDVKNRFPYSGLAKKAELKIADLHYKKESFIEAQGAYEIYKDFYPKDDRIDYITFQIGMSYYKQLPEAIGRDISAAKDAIRYFDEVIQVYPNSDHRKEALVNKEKCQSLLAQKELYIAHFYLKKEEFPSALGRFEDVLKKYPNIGLNKEALYGATLSAYKGKDNRKAKQYLTRLTTLFADSNEARKATKEVGDGLR